MSTLYYAWLAYKLAKETGRNDVCALPSGISVPHMFIVVFVIMMPIAAQTGDPIKGWEAGLTWVFVQSFVLMAGGFIAPFIRKITPRAALLGALAGVSIAFISMRPALEMYMTPVIGIVCFAILLASWLGGVRYFKGMPAGLVAILVGSIIAWGSTAVGLNFGGMSVANLGASFATFGFSFPVPAIGHVFSGFEFLGIILVTAIPFGIYDLVEAMDNVESAAAGLMAGFNAARFLGGQEPLIFPRETVLCALSHYITHAEAKHFQPMNSNWALLPPLPDKLKKGDKPTAHVARAQATMQGFFEEL